MYYVQLDQNDICTGISSLSGEVPEYNYMTPEEFDPITGETTIGEPVFLSRMIEIPKYTDAYIGLRYVEDGKWVLSSITQKSRLLIRINYAN